MPRPDRPIRSHRRTTCAFDQQQGNRRRTIEAQVAGAIHLRLDVFDSPPGVAPRGQGQRTVELFDERQKFGIMTMPELALLS